MSFVVDFPNSAEVAFLQKGDNVIAFLIISSSSSSLGPGLVWIVGWWPRREENFFCHRLTDRQFQLYHHGLREVKYWYYEVVRRRNHWPGYNQRVRSSVSETQDFAVMLKPLWWSRVENDCSAGTRGWFRIQTAVPCLTLPHSPRQQAPPCKVFP